MSAMLHGVASGLAIDAVTRAIPPGCRGRLTAAAPAAARRDGDDVLIETPAWEAAGAVHFVPAFSALTAADYGVRLELAVRAGGGWSPWVAGVELGSARFTPLPPADVLDVDVDVFRARAPLEAVRLRARLHAPAAAAVLAAPWLLSLSAATPVAPALLEPIAARLDVLPLSQMDADAAIAARICSPTCVAMVLGYWGHPVSPAALAAEIFHPATDLYGVWPAAILAAGRRGVAGYLLRFPDWTSAGWCLGRGLPVIASIRYRAGELTGAAVAETGGHLVVLTGCENGDALVNDPAAAGPAVRRRYPIDELARVWLERSGVGYVLFPPA